MGAGCSSTLTGCVCLQLVQRVQECGLWSPALRAPTSTLLWVAAAAPPAAAAGEVRSGHWGFAPAALDDVLPPQTNSRLWQTLTHSDGLTWLPA